MVRDVSYRQATTSEDEHSRHHLGAEEWLKGHDLRCGDIRDGGARSSEQFLSGSCVIKEGKRRARLGAY
jgi:hypothetical protein